jgi:hypothetical protein
MRKLILFLLICISAKVNAQVYQEMPQYGYRANRMAFDSTLQIPTVCGVPTLKSIVKTNKSGAIAYDSCNAVFYTYNPKTLTWSAVSGGGATDTTSLSNRINLKIDSLKRSNDSVYAYRNGTRVFQFKDSAGGGGNFWKTSGTTTTTGDVLISNSNGTITFAGGAEDIAKIVLQANDIDISTSGGAVGIKLIGLSSLIDTTTYKPLMISSTGILKQSTSWVSGGGTSTDTTSLSNRINLKLNISDTSNMLTKYLRKTDTATLSNRINLKVPYTGATQDVDLGAFKISAQSFQVEGTNGLGHIHFKHQNSDATATGQSTVLYANSNGDLKYKNAGNYYSTLKTQQSADRVYTYQNKSYTLADSSDLSAKLNISDTSTLQRKSISAYTILANKTNATANVTAQAFRDTSGVYDGTITWTGTTAPSGATNHTYRLTQVGKCVTINISLLYATNGSVISKLTATLPSNAPTPAQPTGLTSALQNIYVANAQYITSTNTTANAILRTTFRNNAANNGFEFLIEGVSSTVAQVNITCQYWTN